MAQMKQSEYKAEIEEMTEFMKDSVRYYNLVMEGVDLENDSTGKLGRVHKRARFYLEQYRHSVVDICTDLAKPIDAEIRRFKEYVDFKEQIDYLNNKEFHKTDSYEMKRIGDVLDTINRYRREGRVKGSMSISVNLKVEPKTFDVDLVRGKLDLIVRMQECDAMLQRHMIHKAKCLIEDSVYEKQKKDILSIVERMREVNNLSQ